MEKYTLNSEYITLWMRPDYEYKNKLFLYFAS